MSDKRFWGRTGNVRFRENWRGKLILQVEVQGVATFRRYNSDPGYCEITTAWRDAKIGEIYYHAYFFHKADDLVRPDTVKV